MESSADGRKVIGDAMGVIGRQLAGGSNWTLWDKGVVIGGE